MKIFADIEKTFKSNNNTTKTATNPLPNKATISKNVQENAARISEEISKNGVGQSSKRPASPGKDIPKDSIYKLI